ncbi:MAG: phosphodiester glycosidase family protein [Deltaproteobacteria bacterium]|nr:phosphodiester glycosidase family protein [Deltaproteobacteria bacterium]
MPLTLAAVAIALFSPPAHATLQLAKFSRRLGGAPVQAFVVTENGLSPRASWIALGPSGYPTPGISVPEMAAAGGAKLAVNANFYREDKPGAQDPIGLVVRGGRLLSLPNRFYPSAGVVGGKLEWDNVRVEASVAVHAADGTKLADEKLCRIDAPAGGGCAALWLDGASAPAGALRASGDGAGPALGSSTLAVAGDGAWALQLPKPPAFRKSAAKIELRVALVGERLGGAWSAATEAVSGSHVLMPQGTVPAITKDWAKARQPRAFVGVDSKGAPFVAVFDGRRADSLGISLKEAWAFLHKQLHAAWALNLDGGGSTTLMFEGRLVNKPSDGYPRAIAVGFGAR